MRPTEKLVRRLIAWWYGIWENIFYNLWLYSWVQANGIVKDIWVYFQRKQIEYQD